MRRPYLLILLMFAFNATWSQIDLSDKDNLDKLCGKSWNDKQIKAGYGSDTTQGFKEEDEFYRKRNYKLKTDGMAYFFSEDGKGHVTMGGKEYPLFWKLGEKPSNILLGSSENDPDPMVMQAHFLSDDLLILYYYSSYGNAHDYHYFKAEKAKSKKELLEYQVKYGAKYLFDGIESLSDDSELSKISDMHYQSIEFLRKTDSVVFTQLQPHTEQRGTYHVQDDQLILKMNNGSEHRAPIVSTSGKELIIKLPSPVSPELIECRFESDRGETTIRPQHESIFDEITYFRAFLIHHEWMIDQLKGRSNIFESGGKLDFQDDGTYVYTDSRQDSQSGRFHLEFNKLFLHFEQGPTETLLLDTLGLKKARLAGVYIDGEEKSLNSLELKANTVRQYEVDRNKPYEGIWLLDSVRYISDNNVENLSPKESFLRQGWNYLLQKRLGRMVVYLMPNGRWKVDYDYPNQFSGSWKTSQDGAFIFIDDDATKQDYLIEARTEGESLVMIFVDLTDKDYLRSELVFRKTN